MSLFGNALTVTKSGEKRSGSATAVDPTLCFPPLSFYRGFGGIGDPIGDNFYS